MLRLKFRHNAQAGCVHLPHSGFLQRPGAGLGGAAATLGTILMMLFVPMLTAGDNWTPFFIMGASLVPLSVLCVFLFGGRIEHDNPVENK